jgi:hypothetical protein
MRKKPIEAYQDRHKQISRDFQSGIQSLQKNRGAESKAHPTTQGLFLPLYLLSTMLPSSKCIKGLTTSRASPQPLFWKHRRVYPDSTEGDGKSLMRALPLLFFL